MSSDGDTLRERMLADVQRGGLQPLGEYLKAFPGQDRQVAGAYLEAATRGALSGRTAGPRTIGHYRLISELGRGGQGVVFLAEDTKLLRSVALKVLTHVGPGSETAIERFRKEALVASKLSHPGICAVFDAGVAEGLPYIAMQYVEGMTLAQHLDDLRAGAAGDRSTMIVQLASTLATPAPTPGPPETTILRAQAPSTHDAREIPVLVRFFERAARAVEAAHAVGVIHRDLKPANLMVTRAGEPVVLDFGLAHADETGAAGVTRTGDVFGTPAYMAPEQVAGHTGRVDRRTDVYALGVSLFQALTLERPFTAPTREGLFQAILTQDPPDPRRLNPAISRDLKVLIETALEKQPARRYATAAAFADDLLAVLEHRPIRAREIGSFGRLVRWSRREPWKAALLAVLLVALPALATLVTARVKDAPRIEAARRQEAARLLDELLAGAGYELSEGRKERAVELYQQALATDECSAEAVGGLVLAHQNLGNLDTAERLLEVHRDLIGEGSARHLLVAQSELLRGRADRSRELLATAPPPRTAFEHFVVAQRELRLGEDGDDGAYRRALHHATVAILMSPAPTLALTTLRAHVAGHLRDGPAALESAAGLQSQWPGVAEAHYWAAFALFNAGPTYHEAAEAAAKEAVRLAPEVARCRLISAQIAGLRGRVDEALAAYEEAVRRDPAMIRHLSDFGLTLEAKGRRDDAIRVYREAIRIRPGAAYANYCLGVALSEANRNDEALAAYQAAVLADPQFVEARVNLGQALETAGRTDEAEAAYREALRRRPESAEVLNNLGQIARKRGDLDEARQHYEAAIRVKPELFEPRLNLAQILVTLGETGKAIESYREAVRLQSDRPELHAAFAATLIGFGFEAEAEAVLREALRVDPADGVSLANLGKLLQVESRYDEAQPILARAVAAAHPQAASQAEMWLRETESLRERDAKSKERLARHLADDTEPDSAALRASLARIAFQEGKPALAAEWFRLAFDDQPELADDLGAGHRRWALRAAVATATGRGSSESPLEDAARTEWREQALTWLRDELTGVQGRHDAGQLDDRGARRCLSALLRSQDLAALREDPGLATLNPDERARWSKTWAELSALLASLSR